MQKNNPKYITDFLFENNYDTDEDIMRFDDDLKKGYAKLVKHDLIEVDDWYFVAWGCVGWIL